MDGEHSPKKGNSPSLSLELKICFEQEENHLQKHEVLES